MQRNDGNTQEQTGESDISENMVLITIETTLGTIRIL